MQDFYGVEYVESRWTRFVFVWQSIGFESKRNAAFVEWCDNLKAALEKSYANVTVAVSFTPNLGGDVVGANVVIPEISKAHSVKLGLIHYDTLTKSGSDPAKWVVSNLTWQAKYAQAA